MFAASNLPSPALDGHGSFASGKAAARTIAFALRTQDDGEQVDRLCDLALRGLQQMYLGAGRFVQTMRGIETEGGRVLRAEGTNLRYAAIVALGLSRVAENEQRLVLGGQTAADLALLVADQATETADMGAVALAAWAAAEAGRIHTPILFDLLEDALISERRPVATVVCSWALTAALAAHRRSDAEFVANIAADRLRDGQAKSGLFPHALPAASLGPLRAHIGCFADQVYPIQALARLAVATGDERALTAANACAQRICDLQGPAGQWWWHYDTRSGGLVEGYPVYSVHQHAMAPMALLDLWEANGENHWGPVIGGLSWLEQHPESSEPLISEPLGVVWRKIGRREPAKAARSISAVTTSLRPGLHVPGLDRAFPPGPVDYECRPYELGWLLYAWRSAGVVQALGPSEAGGHND
ncbi:MAG TPA: hypothetical protein VL418_17650 [Devosiaceae bacterium]|nr:hypothetical protein [Devosiaceae bacterium]